MDITFRLSVFTLLIIEHMYQSQLANELDCDRRKIRRHVKAMLKEESIELEFPEAKELYYKTSTLPLSPAIDIKSPKYKYYKKGRNAFIYEQIIKKGINENIIPRIRPHHDPYKFTIESRSDNVKPISENWKPGKRFGGGYVTNKYCELDFEGYGKCKLRFTTSHKKKGNKLKETITVYLPSNHKYFDSQHAITDREKRIYDIENWIGRLGYNITTPKLIKERHFGIDTGIKTDKPFHAKINENIWIDISPGNDNKIEFETTDPDVADKINDVINVPTKVQAELKDMNKYLIESNIQTVNSIKEVGTGIINSVKQNNDIISNRLSGLIYNNELKFTEQNSILSNGFSKIVESINDLTSSIKESNKQYEKTQGQIEKSSKYKSKKDNGPEVGYQ